MKLSAIERRTVVRLKKFMPFFLSHFKKCVTRNCKFLKFHLPVHLADDILDFGPATGYDSSIGEANHKTAALQHREERKNVLAFWKSRLEIDTLKTLL